jgi:hypothetical protein
MNTIVLRLLGVMLTALLAGCATSYQSTGFTGGYTETQLAPDAFRISFQGNGFTSSDRAQDFALLRAADVTLSHGFHYFGIVNEANSGTMSSITLPGQSYTSASATGYGNSAYGTAVTNSFLLPIYQYLNRSLVCSYAALQIDRRARTYSMRGFCQTRYAPNIISKGDDLNE